jgi:phosphoglucomutase
VTSQAIHFGTSGWRGIIADDFTFPGVRRASAAIAGHVLARKKSPTIIVGYDTRFFSPEFALASAAVLRSHGCRVLLCDEPTPTPVIAHAILHGKLDGGVNITASHNPAAYNGLKFSGPDGGPALPEITKDIEKRAAATADTWADQHEVPNDFPAVHPREPYFEQLRGMIRFDVMARAKGSFVCDAVHGCGAGWLDRILANQGVAETEIRAERDVLFEGTGPDPSQENLGPLMEAVKETKALAGLATDGDADRSFLPTTSSAWCLTICSRRAVKSSAPTAASRPLSCWMRWPHFTGSRFMRRRWASNMSARSYAKTKSRWVGRKAPA